MFGLESVCEGFDPLILLFSVFFFRSESSGSFWEKRKKHIVKRTSGLHMPCSTNRNVLTLGQRTHVGRYISHTATSQSSATDAHSSSRSFIAAPVAGETHRRRRRFVFLAGHGFVFVCFWLFWLAPASSSSASSSAPLCTAVLRPENSCREWEKGISMLAITKYFALTKMY